MNNVLYESSGQPIGNKYSGVNELINYVQKQLETHKWVWKIYPEKIHKIDVNEAPAQYRVLEEFDWKIRK